MPPLNGGFVTIGYGVESEILFIVSLSRLPSHGRKTQTQERCGKSKKHYSRKTTTEQVHLKTAGSSHGDPDASLGGENHYDK